MPADPTPPHHEISWGKLAVAHHWPSEFNRCTNVGGTHVCRRCLVVWPLSLIVGFALSTSHWTLQAVGLIAFAVLCAPAAIEFCLDHLGVIKASPVRLQVLSALMGVGVGIGIARYLQDTANAGFWAVSLGWFVVCGAAAYVGAQRTAKPLG